MIKIKEIKITEPELKQIFPIINQLRPHLNFEEYFKIVKNMPAYQIFCLFKNEEVVSYIGFAKMLNLYYGNHIWVYDLVTDKTKQGQGYGKILLSYVEKYAKDNKLSCIALSSGLERTNAHKFYEKSMGYEKVSYVFKKKLMEVNL